MVVEKYGSYISKINCKRKEENKVLIPDQMIEVCWHPQTKDYYIAKGYKYTKMRDKFLVKAEDLSKGSHKKVRIICDYCEKEFLKDNANYMSERNDGKDCCKQCWSIKVKESFMNKYGVENPFQSEIIKEKSKQTCLTKYGTERACQSEQVKEKIAKTNLERYGNTMPLLNQEVKEKAINTCLDKFGVSNVFMSPEIQDKIKETNRLKYGEGNIAHTPEIAEKIKSANMEKYGVPYTTQSKTVQKKMRESLYKNGSVPSSKAEKEMCDLLKNIFGSEHCYPNYPMDSLNLDCLVNINGVLIDFEYDGWYWHKNKQESDKRRNYFLIKNGYKVCRFRANYAIPTIEQIKNAVDYLLSGHSLKIIDLDI